MKLPFPMPPLKERKTLSTFTAAQERLPFSRPKGTARLGNRGLSHQRLLTPEKCPGQSHQNSEFICADAAKELPLLVRDGIRPDVVVLDPPRAGCERPVLDAILAVRPKRVVYVSCGPASLARDAAILCEGGYNIRQVQPVDMFPTRAMSRQWY